jgi:hypothetical protein
MIVVTGPGGTVTGTHTYDAATRTLTFAPTEPLAWSTRYEVQVLAASVTLTGGTWTFTTADEPRTMDAQTLFGQAVPQHAAWDDPKGVQVATRFLVDTAGEATGIRFYRGAANTGQHTGYLWTAAGQKIVEIAFAEETTDGWQSVQFIDPVVLQPGVEYRVGLHSTTGRYAVDLGTLATAGTVGPFTIPAQGSAYTYSREFPGNLSSHNYWVDVTFVPSG